MKKNKSNTPRHRRMNRKERLHAAKQWMSIYEGKNIIKGYRKHFGVDIFCAIKELQMLNYKIDLEYISNLKDKKKLKQRQSI